MVSGDRIDTPWILGSALGRRGGNLTDIACIPVMVPLPQWDRQITVVWVDREGNVTIRVDQEKPEPKAAPNAV